ncbi:MAG: alpha/beta hydrolase [Chitinophagales bacterium]|jgi:hypothetical protein|nr:alpha/beta hydrolase [Chitinophagales bacterium]
MKNLKNFISSIILGLLAILMFTNHTWAQKYIFYLHGKIVEDQGANALSPDFGSYQYEAILDSFRKANFIVVSEVRNSQIDIKDYARHVADEINDLLKAGTGAKNVTVVGASKGALIAMYVSTFLKNKEANFVFLAACSDGNFNAFPDIHFYGNILSIYENSDDIGRSCIRFKDRVPDSIPHYKELETNTGLRHGFLFRPLTEWMKPAIKWANGHYD